MKLSNFIVAFCAIYPTSIFGFGAEDASRPVPLTESRSSERPTREESESVVTDQDQPLVPSLLGLAVGTNPKSALRLQSRMKHPVMTDGFSVDDAATIAEVSASAIGQPISLRSLELLSDRLESALRQPGRPFVKVSFPPQEITSGVISVVVCPARVGAVRVSGKTSFGLEFTAKSFRSVEGEILSGDVLMEDLDWINQNPLRRASISYRDGLSSDAIDLTLRLQADKPWRAYTGIDNQLSEGLGNERVFLGFQHGDLFSLDHRVTAQFTSSVESKSLHGISGIYQIPLPVRHLVDASIGYTESESESGGPIDQSGKFARAELVYRIPLPRWQSISQEWFTGMEFRSNDYLFSNDTSSKVRFFDLKTGWKGRRNDAMGFTRVESSLVYSPGQGILGSQDADFIALGGEGAESLIVKLDFERALKIGDHLTLLGRCQSQWSDSTLLSSDQISAGGYGLVRGFDETIGYASTGLVTTLEIQSNNISAGKAGDYQVVTFLDAAFLDRHRAGEVGQIASAGVGLRWRYETLLSARLDLGVPIDCPEEISSNPMLHFSISTTW